MPHGAAALVSVGLPLTARWALPLCCLGAVLLLPWSHGHGQQQDVVFSVLLSLHHHAVLLSPCTCDSPQLLRYVADQQKTLCLQCAWSCPKGLGRALPCQQAEGCRPGGGGNPMENETALLCPKCSRCAVGSSDCKLDCDGVVYCQLTTALDGTPVNRGAKEGCQRDP